MTHHDPSSSGITRSDVAGIALVFTGTSVYMAGAATNRLDLMAGAIVMTGAGAFLKVRSTRIKAANRREPPQWSEPGGES